ncbi:hypothetical protein HPB50_016658 [Hyalomma asiaticum]|uniref:Uncharacterized protein n=1 Tax=Hyalomma asiaticum TaxID=266040 RepID=A0ACB7THI4_HYAAI|nr:hypothetical protein HPB50_016658 [Hyalomma asiaticum]
MDPARGDMREIALSEARTEVIISSFPAETGVKTVMKSKLWTHPFVTAGRPTPSVSENDQRAPPPLTSRQSKKLAQPPISPARLDTEIERERWGWATRPPEHRAPVHQRQSSPTPQHAELGHQRGQLFGPGQTYQCTQDRVGQRVADAQ